MQNSEISGEEQALTAAQAVEPTDEQLMAALSDEAREVGFFQRRACERRYRAVS